MRHIGIDGDDLFEENSYMDDIVNYGQTFMGDMGQKQSFKNDNFKSSTDLIASQEYQDDATKLKLFSQ